MSRPEGGATLSSLQGGRGLAAFAVLAYHLTVYMGDPRFGGDPVFERFTRHGNLGVDFFFVLSGFIILHAHAGDIGRPDRWPRYAFRRLVRLFPIYWLYTIGFLALTAATVAKAMPFAGDPFWWASVVTLVRFSSEAVPLFVAWTLFNELAFYALFSTLILNRRLGLAVLAAWAVISVIVFHYQQPLIGSAADVYSSAYSFNFLLGMAAYGLSRRAVRGELVLAAGLATVAAGLVAAYSGLEVSPFVYAVGFALGVAGAVRLETIGRLRTPRALTALGDASYSLYLLHVPMIAIGLRVLSRLGLERSLAREAQFALILVATLFGGLAAYRWIERPLIARLRRMAPFDRSPAGPGVGPV